jgi:hypothetical protein
MMLAEYPSSSIEENARGALGLSPTRLAPGRLDTATDRTRTVREKLAYGDLQLVPTGQSDGSPQEAMAGDQCEGMLITEDLSVSVGKFLERHLGLSPSALHSDSPCKLMLRP